MGSWWRSMGGWLSRRTLVVLVAVVAITGVFAIGLNKLDFATGQDSYIDPASQVAKDNREYQSLFGGENMVVLFTVPEGKTVADLFSQANIQQMNEVEASLNENDAIASVVSPVALLQWSHDMIIKGVALDIIARTTERDTDEASRSLRETDAAITLQRAAAAGDQSLDNPEKN